VASQKTVALHSYQCHPTLVVSSTEYGSPLYKGRVGNEDTARVGWH